MKRDPALPELARWLHGRFDQAVPEFEAGRLALRDAVAEHLACSEEEADQLLKRLERAGYVRYAAESRSIGGGPGSWMVYPSPGANPDEEGAGAGA